MEKEDSMVHQMAESQQEFRKQFDPNSITFHGGSQQAVPIGGQRVPDSMLTMYPENYNPNQPSTQIDYGEQYKDIEKARASLQNLKKSIAKLPQVLQAFLRHQQIFKSTNSFQKDCLILLQLHFFMIHFFCQIILHIY